jgi:hypothetical protein
MSRFRLFLAWLIMVAIPLQGMAAASMLYCGMGAYHGPAQVAVQAQAEHHDHAQHGHADVTQAKKADAGADKKAPDSSHKCPVCASCCHGAAIAQFPSLAVLAPAPQAEPAEPFVLIHARPSTVPDKPPRA